MKKSVGKLPNQVVDRRRGKGCNEERPWWWPAPVTTIVCAGMAQSLWGEVPMPGFPRSRRQGEGQGVIVRWGLEKLNPKARGDEQEPDTRCGTLGASGHVTAKPSIRKWACFIIRRLRAEGSVSYPGDLLCAWEVRVRPKLAER